MVASFGRRLASRTRYHPREVRAFMTKMLDRAGSAARGRFLVPHLDVTFFRFSWRILILPLPEDGELHEPHKTN
jgi:hypothetical protein